MTERSTSVKPRLMGVNDMMKYLNLGRVKTMEIGQQAKACKRFGKRILFDVNIIDRYLDTIPPM